MKKSVFLIVLLLTVVTVTSCKENLVNDNSGKTGNNLQEEKENLFQYWVLVEKNINGTKEVLPEDDVYPITLVFYEQPFSYNLNSLRNFRGRCDANSYEGIFEIEKETISIDSLFSTDCSGSKWYWDYIEELRKVEKISILQQGVSNNMELQLSNHSGSVVLYYINKEWFEEKYFKLENSYD